MSTRKKFIQSFSWQTVNVATQVVLQLTFIAFIARLIGTEAFGIIGVALAIVGLVEIFSQVGIGPALIQRKDLVQGQINGAFFISLILGIAFTALMLLLGPAIAAYYEYEPLGPILQVIGLSFFISAIAVVPKNMIIKQMQFKKLFIAALIAMTIGNLGIGIGLAYAGYGVWAYVFALLSQNVIMTIMFWIQNPVKITGFSDWSGTMSM
ncbi:MAG: oligosaccharide flippase family protein, partial [Flavobacteriales bacterium]|nr:oligosaccharide flippase family protein [Flavobacteriales bacterium]